MQQEASDEFVGVQAHQAWPARMTIVLPAKRDASVGQTNEAVAAETIEDLLRNAKRLLRADLPFGAPRAGKIVSKFAAFGEGRERGEEPLLAHVEGMLQPLEKESPK